MESRSISMWVRVSAASGVYSRWPSRFLVGDRTRGTSSSIWGSGEIADRFAEIDIRDHTRSGSPVVDDGEPHTFYARPAHELGRPIHQKTRRIPLNLGMRDVQAVEQL